MVERGESGEPVAPVIMWEEPIAVEKRDCLSEVALIICVRLVPNDSGGLKRALEIKDVVLVLKSINAVFAAKAVVLGLEASSIIPKAASLIIKIIPEPT